MPPKELHEDVWIDIVKNYVSGKETFSSLASTNKLIRGLALPILYRQLTMTFDEGSRDEETAPRRLRSICKRVEALQRQTHLLDHVREFKLYFVSPCDGQMSYTPLWTSTYEAVTNLLLTMPHIHTLELNHCLITPRIHSYIYHHTALKSLTLWVCGGSGAPASLNESETLCLKELTYRQRSNWHFPSQLLRCSMSTLTALSIPHAEVPRIVEVVRRHLPSLERLVIKTYPSDKNKSFEIIRLLESCPELRSVDIRASGPGLRPGHVLLDGLANNAVPVLESVGGDLHIVSALVSGRPIRRIRLHDINSASLQVGDVGRLRESTAQVTELTVEVSKKFSLSDKQIERLGSAFCRLSSLVFHFSPGRRDVLRVKDIMDIVAPALSRWTKLRECLLFFDDFSNVTREFIQECFQPPTNFYDYRGHPSLAELGFESDNHRFGWLRFNGEGWVLREFEKSKEGSTDRDLNI